MKKILGFVLVAAMLITLVPTSYASDSNLITNPGFEQDAMDWVEKGATIIREDSQGYNNSKAAGLVRAQGSGYVGVEIDVVKGQKYAVSSQIKTDGNAAFFNTVVKHSDGTTQQVALLKSTDDNWNEMKGEYLHKRENEKIVLYISTNNTASYYIDDVSFVPVGEPIDIGTEFLTTGENIVVVDSNRLSLSVYSKDGVLLVPAIDFAYAIGGSGYAVDNGAALGRGLSTITVKDANVFAEVNGKAKKISAKPQYINGTLFAPAADIATALGVDVAVDTNTVVVSTKNSDRKLNATARKLRADKKLNIGFFTGSLLQRAGTWDPYTYSVKDLVEDWFTRNFADCEINVIEFDQSATGSLLGAFTAEKFVKENDIDLLIVDFMRNDVVLSPEQAATYCESVIKAAKRGKKDVDILWTYTLSCETLVTLIERSKNAISATLNAELMNDFYKCYVDREIYEIIDAIEKVNIHYGIPTLDLGKTLYAEMVSTGKSYASLHNRTHNPNTEGSAIYGAELIKMIKRCLQDAADSSPAVRETVTDVIVGKVSGVKDATLGAGWKYYDKAILDSVTPDYIEASAGGSELEYKFSGNIIGIYFDDTSESGDFYYSIDGGEYVKSTTFLRGLRYPHTTYEIFSDNLSDGEHTLKIKVCSEQNPKSKSTVVRIAGFLVGTIE